MRCGSCGLENPPESSVCDGCGEPLDNDQSKVETQEAPTPKPEILFGRYQVLAELGRGGMGRVLRVLDSAVEEEVALKVTRRRFAEDEHRLERFRNELKLARKIAHRNVCRVFDFAEFQGTPYITMEYIPGESLRHLLDRSEGRKLPLHRATEITRGVCRGLSEAHRLGVVHRDLKPGNILIDEEGEPKISDFGIAHSASTSGLTELGSFIGTPEYMSPEQAMGREVDHRSDIYSLGIILHEMVLGRPPFAADSPLGVALKQRDEPPPQLATLGPDVPLNLAQVIVKCLQKSPDNRYQDVRDILSVLGDRTAPGGTQVAVTAELPSFLAEDKPRPEASAETPFVAREGELARLQELLASALAGQGRVAIVTGEPGSGKSRLTAEFARRSQGGKAELVVASGHCDEQVGSSDPYHPFRQVLELLTGDIEARWAAGALSHTSAARLWQLIPHSGAALAEYGPDLLGTLLNTAPLLRRTAACGGEGQPWYEQLRRAIGGSESAATATVKEGQIHEQYSRVLLSLARRRPLVLIIEDLHWIDCGSANLLVQLGRQIADSPILVVGTCRSAELSLGRVGERHPLAAAINELKRRFGEIEIELDRSGGREFLDAYLESQPNRFSAAFHDKLYAQTAGHPLFTVELLRSMMDRGLLVQDEEGVWQVQKAIDWLALPSRTEGVVGERIERVSGDLREVLDVASVEGDEFTAEVVASVLELDERQAVKLLSRDLDKRHRLVKAIGIQRIDGRRLSQYQFRHALFRKYLYDNLDPVELSFHHEEVGTALESLYGQARDDVVVHLAEHFEVAGNADKAAGYHRSAGLSALRISAFREATDHLQKALQLLDTLPDEPERRQRELELRLSLAGGLGATEGFASPALEENYLRVEELCERPSESPQGMMILFRIWGFHLLRSHRERTQELADQLARVAARTADPEHLVTSDAVTGITTFFEGDQQEALAPLTRAAESFDSDGHETRLVMYGDDVFLDAWFYQAWCQLLRGELDAGWSTLEAAQACTDTLGNPFSVAEAACFKAALRCDLGHEPRTIGESADYCVAVSQKNELPFWLAHGSIWSGWAAVHQDQAEEGLARIQSGLALLEAIGAMMPGPAALVHQADALGRAGLVQEGLAVVDRALGMSARGLDRFYDAEAHRIRGELLLRQDEDVAGAEGSFLESLRVARAQKARLLELRTAISLGRLLVESRRTDEARELVQPVYESFSEGLDTRFPREARQLLERLEQR